MPGYHDPVQQHRRLTCFSLDSIQEYFSQLNPIAKRIVYDIHDTKANYGQLWDTLNYHEQNDIINDTLIKPEISLHYFDNFLTPTPTNSTGNSYQSSTDSLTAIVLKDVSKPLGGTKDEDEGRHINHKRVSKQSPEGFKSYYSYDGRNLQTFGMQKVALKVIQDDALGCFRDEHSRPFCYRTKSQINLFVLTESIMETAAPNNKFNLNGGAAIFIKSTAAAAAKTLDNTKPEEDEETKKALDNYHRLQRQLKMNLSDNLQKTHDIVKISSIKPSSISGNRKIIKSPDPSQKDRGNNVTSIASSKNAKTSLLQNYLQSTQLNATPKIDINYAVFTDSYNVSEESSNLLQHCSRGGDLATASCSSAATSDDDEKTLEAEDVHLLDNDSNIRKGFDFLNNW